MIGQGMIKEEAVVIEDDVWIGARLTLLPRVHVGKGLIVAVDAVVTKSLLRCSIVGGVFAKILRSRK